MNNLLALGIAGGVGFAIGFLLAQPICDWLSLVGAIAIIFVLVVSGFLLLRAIGPPGMGGKRR